MNSFQYCRVARPIITLNATSPATPRIIERCRAGSDSENRRCTGWRRRSGQRRRGGSCGDRESNSCDVTSLPAVSRICRRLYRHSLRLGELEQYAVACRNDGNGIRQSDSVHAGITVEPDLRRVDTQRRAAIDANFVEQPGLGVEILVPDGGCRASDQMHACPSIDCLDPRDFASIARIAIFFRQNHLQGALDLVRREFGSTLRVERNSPRAVNSGWPLPTAPSDCITDSFGRRTPIPACASPWNFRGAAGRRPRRTRRT